MTRFLKKYPLLVFVLTLFAGCSTEEVPTGPDTGTGDGEALVKLELQMPWTTPTRALTAPQDEAVGEVDILVFDRNDNFFDWRHGSLRVDGTTTIVEALLVSSARGDAADKYRIVVFANARERLRELFATPDAPAQKPGGDGLNGNKAKPYAQVMADIVAPAPLPAPNAQKGVPMWGELREKTLIAHGEELGSLTLYRALARVDVVTYKGAIPSGGVEADWNAAVGGAGFAKFDIGNFRIEEVSIHNAPSRYRYAPLTANFNFDGNPNITAPSPATGSTGTTVACTDISSGMGVVRGLYMGEAEVDMGGLYGDGDHLYRPCIIVKGFYSPDGGTTFNTTPSFYRVDFVTNSVTHSMHDVLRNFDYEVVIQSVSGAGKANAGDALASVDTDMLVTVLTWNDADQAATVVDGQDWLTVSRRDITTDKWAKNGNMLDITTSIPEVGGKSWSATVTDGGGWLTLTAGTTVTGVSGGELEFNIAQLTGAQAERTGKIMVTAGNMSLAVLVKQTNTDDDFMLRISSANFDFPGRVWNETLNGGAGGWEAPAPQALIVDWAPRAHPFMMSLEALTGGGVQGFAPAASSDNPTVEIAPSMIAPDDPRVVADPFHERSSFLTVKGSNADGTEFISKQVRIKQVFYSLTIEEYETFSLNNKVCTFDWDYFKPGRTYTYIIKANTAWEATVEGDASLLEFAPQSSTGTVGGTNMWFKVAAGAAANSRATIVFRSPDNLFEPQRIEVIVGPELPNSYIVPTGSSVDVPVDKPYHVWKYDRDLKDLHPGGDLPAGTASAALLWEDELGLITDVSFNPGLGPKGTISVTTAGSGKIGNAVVVFTIDGTIYWSWHIWVTPADYDPVASQQTYNGFTFMDRNLGARNGIVGDAGSVGSYYQVGRKDISRSMGITHEIWDAQGNSTFIDTANGPMAPAGVNLGPSIQNPMAFYRTNYGNGSWYSAEKLYRRQDMWGNALQKGEYDPCPQGWRVMDCAFLYSLGVATPAFGNFTGGNGETLLYLPSFTGYVSGNGYHEGYGGISVYGVWRYSWGEWTGGMGFAEGSMIWGSMGPSSSSALPVRCMKYE